MKPSKFKGIRPVRSQAWKLLALVTGLLTLAGCESKGTKVHALTHDSNISPIERLMLVGVSKRRSEDVLSLHPSYLTIVAESSQVVPGLVYYRGVYRPPRTSHMESVVFVAVRDDSLRLLQTSEDFAAIADFPTPNDSRSITKLCAELAKTLGRTSTSAQVPMLYEDEGHWSRVGWKTPPAPRDRITSPRATRGAADGWDVRLWMAEPGQMTKYQCTFRAAQPPFLRIIDSVAGMGFLPDTP